MVPQIFYAEPHRPRTSREFSNAESLGLFLQLYNLQRDEALERPSVFVCYKILRKGQQIWAATETSDTIRQAGEQVALNRLIPLAAFTPGPYMLQVEVRDRVSGQTISREVEFQIKAQSMP